MGIGISSRAKFNLSTGRLGRFLSAETSGLPQNEEKLVLLSGMVVDQVGAVVANLAVNISARPVENAAAQRENQPTAITVQTDYYGQFSASLD